MVKLNLSNYISKNRVDHDQVALVRAAWSGLALFVKWVRKEVKV